MEQKRAGDKGFKVIAVSSGKYYRTFSLLSELEKKHGASEFGRICQVLLGLTFKELGFHVPICQLSGRPDLRAEKGKERYEIEIKAPVGSEITLKEDDLESVKVHGYMHIIATLSYPEPESKWIAVDADKLKAGKFPKSYLLLHSIKRLERQINKVFPDVVKKYFDNASIGSSNLKRVFDTY